MKILVGLLALVTVTATASEVGNYPNAATLNGSERVLADQGGTLGVPSTTGTTVNITPSQIAAFVIPSQSGESGNCLSTNGTSLLWSACGSGGGLTSVGLAAPSIFTVTGSPLTANGTLTLSYSGTPLPQANGGTGATTLAGASIPVFSGTITSGHCVEWLNGTTIEDAGAGCGSGGSTAFSALTSSTNTTAAMLVGTGASLAPTGIGTITASALNATAHGAAGTWTALQTFANSDIALLGSSTGASTFTSANASATNYTLTFPAITDTLVTLTATQTLTNKSIASTEITGLGTFATANAATPPAIGSTTPAAGSFTALVASSSISGSGFSTYLASPPAIGGTAPAAGAFTTLSATGNLTTNVTGSTQCLHVNSAGVISGVGSDCGAGSTPAFSAITTGSNTTATMIVDGEATLTVSGSGVLNANEVNGAVVPTSAACVATNSSNQLIACTTSSIISGTTGTISGSVATGACDTGTATLTGVASTMSINATAASTSGPGVGWSVAAYMSASNTVTVQVCNATGTTGSPTSTAYNVRAIP